MSHAPHRRPPTSGRFSRRRALGAVPLLALGGTALAACNPAASTRREEAKGLRLSWWGNAERQATTEEITPRQQQEVLFGRATPAQAAAAWFEEASAAIADG